MSMQPYRRKNPLIAAALSFFIPGAGQLYNEDFGKAIILFTGLAAAILTIIYTAISMGGQMMHGIPAPVSIVKIVAAGLIILAIWLYGVIDAAMSAQRIMTPDLTEPEVSQPKTREGLISLGIVLVLFGIICLLIQFGLSLEILIKYGFPLALIVLGAYLMARTGFMKGGK